MFPSFLLEMDCVLAAFAGNAASVVGKFAFDTSYTMAITQNILIFLGLPGDASSIYFITRGALFLVVLLLNSVMLRHSVSSSLSALLSSLFSSSYLSLLS